MLNNINSPEWQAWTAEFLKPQGRVPMDDDQTDIMLGLLAIHIKKDAERTAGIEKDFRALFQGKVFYEHARRLGLKIDPLASAFFIATSKNPGTLVMYVHALRKLQQCLQGKPIDIDLVCHAFPVGFLSEERLHELWELQKVSSPGTDNYLDTVVDAP